MINGLIVFILKEWLVAASGIGLLLTSVYILRTATVAVFYRLLLADSGVAETVT